MTNSIPLYNTIGLNYDSTRKADPYIVSRLAGLLQLNHSDVCLDIACGTGNYTVALAAMGGRWCGVELSETMIANARYKDHGIDWKIGDAELLPFDDDCFDKILCTLAIHHFADLTAVFEEAYRVLRNGRLVIFTSYPEQTERFWLAEYFPSAITRSAEQLPARESVIGGLEKAGFNVVAEEHYDVAPDLQDLFLYAGKHRPTLYLDSKVRAGISTFASLASAEEVGSGLLRLEEDIHSGRIEDVITRAEHAGGDYVFVVAKKMSVA